MTTRVGYSPEPGAPIPVLPDDTDTEAAVGGHDDKTTIEATGPAVRDELPRLRRVWRPHGRPPVQAGPANAALAGFWLAGAVLTAVLVLAGGITGWRLDEGLAAAALAALVAFFALVMGRHTPDRFPWTTLHLTVLAAAFGLFVGASQAHPATVGVAILALAVLVAVVVGALMPPAWALVDLVGLCAGEVVVSVARHLEAPLVAPLLGAVTVGSGLAAAGLATAIRRLALRDPVTGLPNRAALELVVERQLAVCRRTGAPLTLVLVSLADYLADMSRRDPDHVDWAVRDVVTSWNGLLRGSDLLARYGATDLVLVLHDCDQAGVGTVVGRMLAVTGDQGAAGATGYVPGDSFATMMERARRSLSHAWVLGRGETMLRSADGTELAVLDAGG